MIGLLSKKLFKERMRETDRQTETQTDRQTETDRASKKNGFDFFSLIM